MLSLLSWRRSYIVSKRRHERERPEESRIALFDLGWVNHDWFKLLKSTICSLEQWQVSLRQFLVQIQQVLFERHKVKLVAWVAMVVQLVLVVNWSSLEVYLDLTVLRESMIRIQGVVSSYLGASCARWIIEGGHLNIRVLQTVPVRYHSEIKVVNNKKFIRKLSQPCNADIELLVGVRVFNQEACILDCNLVDKLLAVTACKFILGAVDFLTKNV